MEHPCTLQIFPFSFISRSSVCLSLLPHLYLDAQLTETHLSNFWLKVIVFLSPKQGFILSSHCLIGTIYFSFLSVFMSIIRHYFFFMLPLMCIFLSGLYVWQEPLFSSSFCHLSLAPYTAGAQKLLISWINGWRPIVLYIFILNWIWEENLIYLFNRKQDILL